MSTAHTHAHALRTASTGLALRRTRAIAVSRVGCAAGRRCLGRRGSLRCIERLAGLVRALEPDLRVRAVAERLPGAGAAAAERDRRLALRQGDGISVVIEQL